RAPGPDRGWRRRGTWSGTAACRPSVERLEHLLDRRRRQGRVGRGSGAACHQRLGQQLLGLTAHVTPPLLLGGTGHGRGGRRRLAPSPPPPPPPAPWPPPPTLRPRPPPRR